MNLSETEDTNDKAINSEFKKKTKELKKLNNNRKVRTILSKKLSFLFPTLHHFHLPRSCVYSLDPSKSTISPEPLTSSPVSKNTPEKGLKTTQTAAHTAYHDTALVDPCTDPPPHRLAYYISPLSAIFLCMEEPSPSFYPRLYSFSCFTSRAF